ncbi:circadian clock protein PASD1 [Manis javanica]|uniref:circadian clock protein PASD1 n=1 Tax=Manis javanica TaxID=9974 RepID=UPI003C6D4F5B
MKRTSFPSSNNLLHHQIMDKEEKEKEKRDVPSTSEDKRNERIKALFRELFEVLQTYGSPVKEDRSRTSQGTPALSQKEGEVNPEISGEEPDWIPQFHSCEDFKSMTLQSLDGFMIILGTDGVIIFVGENISSLLGHLPNEIIGKTLLSLLPFQEKKEVYKKIALKEPISDSDTDRFLSNVGKHIDFCCNLRRGNVDYSGSFTYEYVKFTLTIKDISKAPLVLLSSFFPTCEKAQSCTTYLPLEDRFYLVGFISVLRTETLRELFTVKEASEDVLLVKDTEEEHQSMDSRCNQGQRSSGMESLYFEPIPATSHDQTDTIMVKPYGSPESVRSLTGTESDTTYESSLWALESTCASPAVSSLHSLEFEHKVEQVDDRDKVEDLDQMDELEEVQQEDEEEDREEQEIQVELEAFSPSSMALSSSVEILQPPPSITSYIRRRELKLMRKFRKQLDEKTRMLQADIKKHQDALEMINRQLHAMQESNFQMQPTATCHGDSPEPQSLEPAPKKQRTEKMKKMSPDLKEPEFLSCSHSSHSFTFPIEPEESCDDSIWTQEPYLLQQLQQMQKQWTQQPQQWQHLPLYDDCTAVMQTQPMLAAEQQHSGQEDERQSFLPEDKQGSSMNLLPLAHSPKHETNSLISFLQSPIHSDADNLATLESLQDYTYLLHQLPEPQPHLQVPGPEAGAQEPLDLQAYQDPADFPPGSISYLACADQSDVEQPYHRP